MTSDNKKLQAKYRINKKKHKYVFCEENLHLLAVVHSPKIVLQKRESSEIVNTGILLEKKSVDGKRFNAKLDL